MGSMEKNWRVLHATRVAYEAAAGRGEGTEPPHVVALIDALEDLETRVIALESERVFEDNRRRLRPGERDGRK